MKSKTLILSLLFVSALSLGAINCWAAAVDVFPLHIIGVPGWSDYTTATGSTHAASADIGWVDANRYYIADRGASTTTGSGRVTIIDALTDEFLISVTGFVGAGGKKGPNGVLVLKAAGGKELWAGDGDSKVKIVDLKSSSPSIIASVNTGGSDRADELAYDSKDRIILVGNDKETNPFLTFISQNSRTIVTTGGLPGHITYDGSCTVAPCAAGKGPKATNGLEQPAYDPKTGKFYVSVPQTSTNPKGEVDVINPKTQRIEKIITFTTDCVPHGLAVGFHSRLLVGCSFVSTATPPGRGHNSHQ